MKKKIYDVAGLETLASGVTPNGSDVVVMTVNKPGGTKDYQYMLEYNKLKTLPNYSDAIDEITPDAGVTVDGVVLKDGQAVIDKDVVTQQTNISTAVTIDKPSGVITTVSLTAAAGVVAGTFTVNNSFVKSTSVVLITPEYLSSATATPSAIIQDVANGSFKIKIRNQSASGSLNNVVKIHFVIL